MPGTRVGEGSGCFTGTGCRFEKPKRCRDGGGDGKPQCGCLMTLSGTLKPHSCGCCPNLKRYFPWPDRLPPGPTRCRVPGARPGPGGGRQERPSQGQSPAVARAVTPDFIRAYSKRGERPRCRLGPRSEHNGEMRGFTAKEDVGTGDQETSGVAKTSAPTT